MGEAEGVFDIRHHRTFVPDTLMSLTNNLTLNNDILWHLKFLSSFHSFDW